MSIEQYSRTSFIRCNGGEGGDSYVKMADYPFYFNNCTIDMINKVGSLLQYKQWHSGPVSTVKFTGCSF